MLTCATVFEPIANTFRPNVVYLIASIESAAIPSHIQPSAGKPKIGSVEKSRNAREMPETICAFVMSMIVPRTTICRPSVAMNGGTLPSKMMTPLMSPIKVVAATATMIDAGIDHLKASWSLMNIDDSTPERPTTAPTDRSMPPDMMTKVMPMAMTP
ncbi:MAG: hypothetical protein BWY81_00823 [Firmicutes bacterium ADurb.Bin467]|nr:MAG: hypothetical protein BWY81_00823 [Firmicutes bacterium ADurb.Bin467]